MKWDEDEADDRRAHEGLSVSGSSVEHSGKPLPCQDGNSALNGIEGCQEQTCWGLAIDGFLNNEEWVSSGETVTELTAERFIRRGEEGIGRRLQGTPGLGRKVIR